MQPRYRAEYEGEFIVLGTNWADGTKQQEREWIDNPLEVGHRSPRAVVIGSAVDRRLFNYTLLENHVGGLRGSLSMQTYGVDELWSTMRFDYLVAESDDTLKEIATGDYSENTVVYASTNQCMAYPGKFFIVPHQPLLGPLAQAVYLAAFDGHQEIYMLGCTRDTAASTGNWINDVESVIAAYQSTKFILVGIASTMPPCWRKQRNTRTMTYREFISHCDV